MRAGFPHSDICGSKLVCQLPAAFRRLPRPSSPVIAKASTTCTYSLDPITLSPQGSLPEVSPLQAFTSALGCHHLVLSDKTRRRYNHQTQSIFRRSPPTGHAFSPGSRTASDRFTSSKFLKNSQLQSIKSHKSDDTQNLSRGAKRRTHFTDLSSPDFCLL